MRCSGPPPGSQGTGTAAPHFGVPAASEDRSPRRVRKYPPRLRVALVGADGAGKSTITRLLETAPLPAPVKRIYMGVNLEASSLMLPTTRLLVARQAAPRRTTRPRRLGAAGATTGRRSAAAAGGRRRAAPRGWWCGCSRSGCARASPGATPGPATWWCSTATSWPTTTTATSSPGRAVGAGARAARLDAPERLPQAGPGPLPGRPRERPVRPEAGVESAVAGAIGGRSTCGLAGAVPAFEVVDADRPLDQVFTEVVDVIRRYCEDAAA